MYETICYINRPSDLLLKIKLETCTSSVGWPQTYIRLLIEYMKHANFTH